MGWLNKKKFPIVHHLCQGTGFDVLSKNYPSMSLMIGLKRGLPCREALPIDPGLPY